MEQDMEICPSEHVGLTKKLLSKSSKEYGTIQSFEVDAAIPFVPFDSSTVNQEVNRSTTVNGSLADETIPFHRRTQQRQTGGTKSLECEILVSQVTTFFAFVFVAIFARCR